MSSIENKQNGITMSAADISALADEIASRMAVCTKEMLTSDEAARYLGISKSQLYRLSTSGTIPYYKPTGKLSYFKRTELENWLKSVRISTSEEIDARVAQYRLDNPPGSHPARRGRQKGSTGRQSARC